MSAEWLALNQQGLSYSQIAAMVGVTRNAVAGSIFRYKNPRPGTPHKPFRDPERVRVAVERANQIGLGAAARELGVDPGQLCRWRQRLAKLEFAA